MATRQYKAAETDIAMKAVTAQIARLGDLLGFEIAPLNVEARRDPEMTALLRIQAIRTNLDRALTLIEVIVDVAPDDEPDETDDDPDGDPDDEPDETDDDPDGDPGETETPPDGQTVSDLAGLAATERVIKRRKAKSRPATRKGK